MNDQANGNNRKERTIQFQIFKGYFLLTGILCLLVVLSVFFLKITENSYQRITSFQNQQYSAQQVVTAHYQWLEQLSDSITTGASFQGSLDPTSCALGRWISGAEADMARYPEIKAALENIVQPHQEIHLQAQELIELSRTDRDAAYERYSSEFKPKVEAIGQGLTAISAAYQDLADEIQRATNRTDLISNVLLVLIGVCSVFFCLNIGRRVSKRISTPILTVAEWSEAFATGVENLRMEEVDLQGEDTAVEIRRMMEAFQALANSIRDNVRVIQKVASGDLTAYVDIRSQGDSLGRNLYHLVQSNDFMFANLLSVADSVAQSAGGIADASQSLANSSTAQANAVELLSGTMDQANDLAQKNAENALHAEHVIGEMRADVATGQEKMDALLRSVQAIQEASGKISSVLKAIDDIAFQTNILALNAAVEAARAGEAGKGFAVVADEVRNLALKSSEAAKRSRGFIEDTIRKADEGSDISREASETFHIIVGQASQVSEVIEGIQDASAKQQAYIGEIHEEIQKISAAVSDNAAFSEQTAASTQEMTTHAEVIRKEMHRFNLRKREKGKPYIPPEKKDDEQFVQVAFENYQKAKQQGGGTMLTE